MARITINVTNKGGHRSVADYVRMVADQIEDNYVCGYHEAGTYWDSEDRCW